MAANRCVVCSINFPPHITQCPVCEESLLLSPYSLADENWEDAARSLLEEGPEFMFIFFELYPHKADNNVPTRLESGQLWVDHRHVLEAGYGGVEDGTILFLNNIFYEVQGWSNKREAWWIQEIDPASEFDDVPVLSSEEPDAET